jgi:outer membrane protein OmpA-like peptidoglycan-associated protein
MDLTRSKISLTFFAILLPAVVAALPGTAETFDFGDRAPTLDELKELFGTQRSIVLKSTPTSNEPPPAHLPNVAHAPQSIDNPQPARTPQPADAHQAVNAAPQSNTLSQAIRFELNSAELKPSAYPILDSVAGYMKAVPDASMMITGHTDASGSADRNLTLSQRRAMSVQQALIYRYGIAQNRLLTTGMGEYRPLTSDPFNPKNRRVEFQRTN